MKLSRSYNLKALYPKIAQLWHPQRNDNFTPEQVTPGSHKKVWWKCEKGHEWKRSIYIMIKITAACPYCSGRKKTGKNPLPLSNPELAKQWHPTKNKGMKPEDVSMTTNKKVWWLCENGHIWEARVITRYRRPGCPYCNRKAASKDYNLELDNPKLAKQWHPTLNGKLKPTQVTPGSHKKVWWICEKGHEWRAKVSNRNSNNSHCPYCAGQKPHKVYNLRVVHPELANQWHPKKNGDLTPEQVTPSSGKKVWWKCKKKHVWKAQIASRSAGKGCPYCAREKSFKLKGELNRT